MPLCLTGIANENLALLTRVFQGLYEKARADRDSEMMRILKAILGKVRLETNTRIKKVKSLNITIPTFDELGFKTKGGNIEAMQKKLRLKITEDVMSKNGIELHNFAKRVRAADPAYQRYLTQQVKKYNEAWEAMLVNSVKQAGSKTAATPAFGQLAEWMVNKYGAHAMKKIEDALK